MRLGLAELGVGVSWAVAGAAFGQFTAIPRDGYRSASAQALSSDGRAVAGSSRSIELGNVPFVWTAAGGRYDFGREPGFPVNSAAFGISGDGSAVVGTVYGSQGTPIAYRWNANEGYRSLGTLGGTLSRSFARDANRDGSVVVGHAIDRFDGMSEPFIWSEERGMRSLGRAFGRFLNQAVAVSDDGSKVVGWSVGGFDFGWTWTEEGGYEPLATMDGTDGSSYATGANSGASIIVGTAGLQAHAAMWRHDEIVSLGALQGSRFLPTAVDDLGSIVVGYSDDNVGSWVATIWTESGGARRFDEYLSAHGITVPTGVEFLTCAAVSADGTTFTGGAWYAGDPNSAFAYVVTVPCPASLLAVLGFAAITRRRR